MVREGTTPTPTPTPTRTPTPTDPPARGLTSADGASGGAGIDSTVFGLDVRGAPGLPLLAGSRARATGRSLEVSRTAAACGWTGDRSEEDRTLCSQRRSDGSTCFRIDALASGGYCIWGAERGSHLLSADGRRLRLAPEGARRRGWERFLVGQVLPFAALVSGLEIFHASAVVLDGRASAFVGPPGAGKTSVALEACRLGAGFLADDVLALEPHGEALMAHPGTPLAGVDRGETRRLADAGRPLSYEVAGEDARERLVRTHGADAPAPLGAVFFLDRRSDGELNFHPAADARLLLASTFNLVLDTPGRMLGLLEVCALAARCRVERIAIPPSVGPSALAAAVLERLSGAR